MHICWYSREWNFLSRRSVSNAQPPHVGYQKQIVPCWTIMCIESFFGIPLKKAVYGLGLFKLILTLVFAIISIVEQSQEVCKDDETKKPIQCVGPMVQKVFFYFVFPEKLQTLSQCLKFSSRFSSTFFSRWLAPSALSTGQRGEAVASSSPGSASSSSATSSISMFSSRQIGQKLM